MPAVLSADDEAVAPLVRKTAAWAWRLLVIGAAGVGLLWVIARLQLIVVPVLLATILAALLLPAVDFLHRRGAPRAGAVALVLLSGLAVVGGVLTFVIAQFINGAPDLAAQVERSIIGVQDWLIEGPFKLSRDQIDQAGTAAIEALRNNQERLTSGALSTATTITEILAGAVLALFTLIFLLHGGRNIFAFITLPFPPEVRERVRDAGRAGFRSLVGFVRATFAVALVDAIGIGAGLAILGVPLALPLASLVFLGAFIPLIGAFVTGFLAVVVALIAKGFIYALITLGLIVAVQQLEGHVLQPLIMGYAVRIHPLAIVLAIGAGGVLAGIIGALLAVPIMAFVNSAGRVLLAPDPAREEAELEAEEGPLIGAEPDPVDDAEPVPAGDAEPAPAGDAEPDPPERAGD
ncbi:AI-2E family transporter [Mycolicibacterium thermoresistibile]|uniref:Transmembrane protein n=1 Tax=Mycolicibacterium thermoresistibile TaxID=1797 RepID=A0A100XER7_MYCTH|nr:AI-2E family transporter [Mycolicibacterium thermoresistibile]MCV7189379.1 AI-2E family transporter [Mycolicibacterium thermoresistibile]GAT15043.1 transmembrane protein [Mycolicibacterium thermoresistibile]SNW16407.1 integral membrane protein [Mycolicibacterium thermoresistibile]